MSDPMLRERNVVEIQAPYPPFRQEWLRRVRPWLRRLGILKPGKVRIYLEEMDFPTYHRYLRLLFGGLSTMYQMNLDAGENPFAGMVDGVARAGFIARQDPELYELATGIRDAEFFRSLAPSAVRDLEEAIEGANPAIEDAKKNLERNSVQAQAMVRMMLEETAQGTDAVGPRSSTTLPAATEPMSPGSNG